VPASLSHSAATIRFQIGSGGKPPGAANRREPSFLSYQSSNPATPFFGPRIPGCLEGGVAVAVGARCGAEIDATSCNWGQLVLLRAGLDVFLRLLGWGTDGDDRG
jgi:hypothetical protein